MTKTFEYLGHKFSASSRNNKFKSDELAKYAVKGKFSELLTIPQGFDYDSFYKEAKKAGLGNCDLFTMDDEIQALPVGYALIQTNY